MLSAFVSILPPWARPQSSAQSAQSVLEPWRQVQGVPENEPPEPGFPGHHCLSSFPSLTDVGKPWILS